ncbi:hypothetical protein RD792_003180 [Penstemon davidsonii]|uniref:NAD-dependent epimerase/dehydratase domain-containing protein n=1 Tax=Penstemon davidsonii TaxID=160366 RepID=A0ABR0DT22_9LAMI|nr:hypothetical protein RD792_003180 [Penstemon davidsonii]
MKTVAVTGGSGYIASWIIKFLLEKGYTVKASVRYPDDPKKTNHLFALDGAKERLKLIKADLLEEGSFDALVEGCEGVFHTASPFFLETNNPQDDLLDPALKGTLNVLNSVKKTPSVKRVVLTSSEAAVSFNGKPRTPEVVVDETWFSDPDFCRENKLWYVLSKTAAENAAWKFAKENNIDLVVMNPALVLGPLLQPTLNTSSAVILNLINGMFHPISISIASLFLYLIRAETYANVSVGCVNVKDVAKAHILAFENPSASGRYVMVERVAHYSEIVEILRKLYPTLKLPEKCDSEPPLLIYQVSKDKIRSLGIELTPLEVSVKETVESLKEKNFFKAP